MYPSGTLADVVEVAVRVIVTVGMLLLAVIVQSTLVPQVNIGGYAPDVLLIVVVMHALLFGLYEGAVFGFFAGLAEDLLGGGIFGVGLLSKLFLGIVFGLLQRRVFKENFFLPAAACLIAAWLAGFWGLYWMQASGIDLLWAGNFAERIFPRSVFTMIVALPVHRLLMCVYERADRW